MQLINIIFIAIGLAMDASAVSLAAATSGYASDKRAVFRLSFHFGLFQFLMPLLGWLVGASFSHLLLTFDHWIAFGLLFLVGGKMIFESFNDDDSKNEKDPSKGLTMVMLSIATSIDALAVGVSLAMINVDIWYAALIIGIITSLLSLIAIRIGKKIGNLFGGKLEIAGGVILILIGIKILLTHS